MLNYWENPSGSKWAEENRSMPYSDYAKVRCFFKDRLLECCLLELMRSFKNLRLWSFLNFTISEHRAKIKLGQIRFKWVDLGEPGEQNEKDKRKTQKSLKVEGWWLGDVAWQVDNTSPKSFLLPTPWPSLIHKVHTMKRRRKAYEAYLWANKLKYTLRSTFDKFA